MAERIPVVVVGAGPAGLATSQQLKERGVPHRVLERGDTVGYTWANLYDSLTLHTGKHMSSLPGLPFSRSAPLFVPRRSRWRGCPSNTSRTGFASCRAPCRKGPSRWCAS